MIVSLDELKAHLRVQTDDEDTFLISLLAQAQEAAEDYCRADFHSMNNPPETVRLAVLLMASHFYECRDSSDRSAYSTMIRAFHALLYPNRTIEDMF